MHRWFAIHTQNGAEQRVKRDLEERARAGMLPGVRQLHIPTEPAAEVRGGRKVVVEKRLLPGYVLVQMDATTRAIAAVRHTKGVIGFVGDGAAPSAMAPDEVERLLHPRPEARPKVRLHIEIGQKVEVAEGPMAGFVGDVVEVNEDAQRVKILAEVFGRLTPVEVGVDQVKIEVSPLPRAA